MSESTVPGPSRGQVIGPVGTESSAAEGLELKVRSQWSYARDRFFRHRMAVAGLLGLAIIFGTGIFANWIAPYKLGKIDLHGALPPLHPPTTIGTHWMGTNNIGSDELSEVIYGIRTSLEVGVFVAVASSIFGMIVGAIAGYYRGLIDNVLMRVTDLVLTLPVLAILIAFTGLIDQRYPSLAGNQWVLSVILAGFFWTGIARIVRGVFLSLREKEYVEAAKASGAGDMRIMFRHILPNTMGPIIVNGTLAVGAAILTEAALSFLGFGITPPHTSLGALVADAQNYPQAWWLTIFPGVTIVLIVLCVNFVGDGLRDALDPTQRRIRA